MSERHDSCSCIIRVTQEKHDERVTFENTTYSVRLSRVHDAIPRQQRLACSVDEGWTDFLFHVIHDVSELQLEVV